MKNEFYFMTHLFDTARLEPPIPDDNHFGEDLAKWVAERSGGDEFEFGPPVQQAKGWSELVKAGGEEFMLGFEIDPASIGAEYAEWHIKIKGASSWRSTGSSDTPMRGRLCDLIHNILRSERHIREVQWN